MEFFSNVIGISLSQKQLKNKKQFLKLTKLISKIIIIKGYYLKSF